ncbi:hypothetical protein [Agromyces sp. M3QZ16-3]|uniref:hypothetical protein n=1 Tax=Agromyces sp. M3QZ16-3 TaxID=3447585 RepID=UPI003F68C055
MPTLRSALLTSWQQPPPLSDFGQACGGAPGEGRMSEVVAAPAKRPVVVWDLVLTIVLLVLMAGLAFVLLFFSFFLAFASDSCGASSACDYDRMGTGMLLAMILPIVVAAIALIAAVVVLVLKRIAFWIPIAGMVLMVGAFALGAALTASGVQPA